VAAISFTTSLNFASQLVGTTGAPQPITITNSSSAPYGGTLTVSQAAVTGTNKTDFTITANSCSGTGSSVATGNSCAVQVAFDPQEGATCGDDPSRSATLQLQDNAPGSPHLIPLTGPAADFCLAAANGQPVTTPVTAGQPALFNLDVASSGGFTGTVQLSCSEQAGVDLGACSMSPASVQASPNAVSNFTVTVPTYAASSTSMLDPRGGTPFGWNGKFAVEITAVAICVLLCIVGTGAVERFSGRANDNLLRIVTIIQIAALVLAFSVGIAACGGGGADPAADASTPGTPPGTYTVMLTAAATSGGTSVTKLPVSLSFNVE
jgi:hypothetical protein